MDTPCRGCKDRRADPNCHTDCEKYLAYKNKLNDWQDKVYKNKMNEELVWLPHSIAERTRRRKEQERNERNK